MTIGENIKRFRKQRMITLKKIAEKVGITEQAVSQYERNIRTPNLETTIQLAAALGVDVDDLVRGTELSQQYFNYKLNPDMYNVFNAEGMEKIDIFRNFLKMFGYDCPSYNCSVSENEDTGKKTLSSFTLGVKKDGEFYHIHNQTFEVMADALIRACLRTASREPYHDIQQTEMDAEMDMERFLTAAAKAWTVYRRKTLAATETGELNKLVKEITLKSESASPETET